MKSPAREYTLYQILVLCGTRTQKQNNRLGEMFGLTPGAISTWPSRGIPYRFWSDIAELARVTIQDICRAQAHARNVKASVEMVRYHQAVPFSERRPRHIDNEAT